MSALLLVIIIVAAGAVLSAILTVTGVVRRPDRLRQGNAWMDHIEDIPVAERRSEDDRDAEIPYAAPRGRA